MGIISSSYDVSLCISVCGYVNVQLTSEDQKRASYLARAGVPGQCELPMRQLGAKLSPLSEQKVLLPTKPFSSP